MTDNPNTSTTPNLTLMKIYWGVAAHAFNYTTQEEEAARST